MRFLETMPFWSSSDECHCVTFDQWLQQGARMETGTFAKRLLFKRGEVSGKTCVSYQEVNPMPVKERLLHVL